jgi:hypothetical protein
MMVVIYHVPRGRRVAHQDQDDDKNDGDKNDGDKNDGDKNSE